MAAIKAKLRSRAGFSFTEMLIATAIMLLATGLLTQTMDLAVDQFYKQTLESEAQILCSSISTYMENELAYSTVTTGSDGSISISSNAHGMGSDIHFGYVKGPELVGAPKTQSEGTTQGGTSGDYGFTGTIWPSSGGSSGESGNTGGESGSGEGSSMQVAESSPTYSAQFASKSFNIAGAGAYAAASGKRYTLTSAMNMSWDGTKFTVDVSVKSIKTGAELASNRVVVSPSQIKK